MSRSPERANRLLDDVRQDVLDLSARMDRLVDTLITQGALLANDHDAPAKRKY